MPVGRSIQPNELAQFASEIQGVEEKRRWALYDSIIFAAAAVVTGDANLFQLPIGQGAPAKTLLDTNMHAAGTLPARQGFEIWDVRVQVELRLLHSSITSVTILNNNFERFHDLIYGASLTLRQAQKTDLELAPLAFLPAGYGATGVVYGTTNLVAAADTGGGASLFSNGHPSKAALWDLDPLPIILLPQRQFVVVINFPAAITLPAGVGMRLWVHLDGILHRAA
jgi:hypothetical protein